MNVLYSDTTCRMQFLESSIALGKELTDRLINAGVKFTSVAQPNRTKNYVNVTYAVYKVWIDGEERIVANMKEFIAENFTESYGYVINRLKSGGYKHIKAVKIGEVSVSYPKSSPPPVTAVLLEEYLSSS